MKRLKLGMVGGGEGAFIGGVHRIAARIDNRFELVAGAFSSDPLRSKRSGEALGVARSYANFEDMAKAEAAREDGIDAVSIVTPNHMHAAPAIAFLEAGIAVICDKPLCAQMSDAEAIAEAVKRTGTPFFLTHNYSAYPLMRQAREMVARGDLGNIRLVQVEYAQDWLAEDVQNKQADWRTDPSKSGVGGAIGDIGTHAFQLAQFVAGQKVTSLLAELDSFVAGRKVDDNAQILLRFENGAKGMLWASQVAVGCENGLKLRVYGSKGSIEWQQENPNQMRYAQMGAPVQILTRAGARSNGLGTRVPAGHPEGYLEGFANLYSDIADQLEGIKLEGLVPSIQDGIEGMRFISSAVRSSSNGNVWVKV